MEYKHDEIDGTEFFTPQIEKRYDWTETGGLKLLVVIMLGFAVIIDLTLLI